MTDDDVKVLKNAFADATAAQLRDIHLFIKEAIPDATDNRTNVEFRTTVADKTMLRELAISANTSVSAICRSTISDALRRNFG